MVRLVVFVLVALIFCISTTLSSPSPRVFRQNRALTPSAQSFCLLNRQLCLMHKFIGSSQKREFGEMFLFKK
ncbi:unnamed protein product [Caenorhabditis angaria]|uniref:Secreted protein n=1 Tax=Caenorhabditis angaria TaxID=860376 RepID=A0A9P1I9F0_9PELO|nr:unnamed protein product [Caenorhabditis angaria]